jgi:hypothetical protein
LLVAQGKVGGEGAAALAALTMLGLR